MFSLTQVGIGRPALWGLSAYGQQGVEHILNLLKEEMEMTMRLLGATSVEELNPALVSTAGLRQGAGHIDHLATQVYDPLSVVKAKI